jgi:iron-sulfur cluster repair protein YtfE (RIC family)
VLVSLGHGPHREQRDVVDMLLACHERIRAFTGLARRLGSATDASEAEVRDAAATIGRYFREGLPLHVLDEEELVVPRLVGRDAALDAALATMASEHTSHAPVCERLIAVCDALAQRPGQLHELATELAEVGAILDTDFTTHLAAEERLVFPALAALPDADRMAIAAAMQARRQPR